MLALTTVMSLFALSVDGQEPRKSNLGCRRINRQPWTVKQKRNKCNNKHNNCAWVNGHCWLQQASTCHRHKSRRDCMNKQIPCMWKEGKCTKLTSCSDINHNSGISVNNGDMEKKCIHFFCKWEASNLGGECTN